MTAAAQPGSGGSDALAVLFAQGGMLVASLAVQSLLAWQLLPAGRGDYAVLVVLGTLLPTLCMVGLDRALPFQLMSGRIDAATALGSLTVVAAVATCGALALLGAADAMAWVPPLRSPGAWPAAVLLVAAGLAHAVTLRMHVASRRYRRYLLANVLQSVVGVVALLAVLVLLDGGYVLAVAALGASYAVAATFSFAWLLGDAGGPLRLVPRELRREAAGFGVRYYPALVAHSIDFNAGTLVLAAMASSAEVGIYAALSALMLKFLLLAQALQEALLPRIAADAAGRPELVARMARLAVAVTAVVVVAFLLVSKWVVALLLSPAFVEGLAVARWLGPGIVAHAASTVLMPHFEGRGQPGVVSVATWTGLAVNLAGIAVLYPPMGLGGAGLAMTLGLVARLGVLIARFHAVSGHSVVGLLVPRRGDVDLAWAAVRKVAARGRAA